MDDFPKSYTIDVGILEDGENVVIEFNDMWGIGNYGVDNHTYLRLLKSRYFEIMKKNHLINIKWFLIGLLNLEIDKL